jgi:hypothetical protein
LKPQDKLETSLALAHGHQNIVLPLALLMDSKHILFICNQISSLSNNPLSTLTMENQFSFPTSSSGHQEAQHFPSGDKNRAKEVSNPIFTY